MSISADNHEKIKTSETSELEGTLAFLADNTAMTLAALSSTSLLDRVTRDEGDVFATELDEMITRTGFDAVSLKRIMRSTQNIAAATSPDSLNQARSETDFEIKKSISPGSSSTVPGTRPRAMVYKHTRDVDYSKLAGFVTQHLKTVDTERLKCVVLTEPHISPRQLSVELIQSGFTQVSCYDGGVERFNYYDGRPEYREGGAGDGGEVELTEWLRAEAGVFVTSEHQFRGCEADTVIFVTRDWAGHSRSRRSPVTRAVAGLTLVIGDEDLRVQELRRNWDVEIVEEGVKIE